MTQDELRVECLFYMVHGDVVGRIFDKELGDRWERERKAMLRAPLADRTVMLALIDEVIQLGSRLGGKLASGFH